MVRVEIEHGDGTKDVIPETTSWSRKRELGKMRRAQIEVERSLVQGLNLQEKTDLVHLGDIDTLRLTNIDKGGSTWTLKCYSLEWDANRVAPTRGGSARSGTDRDLIESLIGEVPSWEAGTLTTQSGPLNFVFNHALRHEALRRIERNTVGELRFRDEGVLDYVASLGTDRSGTVELSASAQTIEDAIRITQRGRKFDGTHIRVLGAHEGEAQLFANLVPAGDTAAQNNYENVVTYTSPRWSSDNDTDWDRWENKDITSQATIDEEAETIGEEIKESLVEATTTVSGVDPPLKVGDWVQVVKPDADLDRRMRVHRITTNVGADDTGPTRLDDVLLSTRTIARDDNVRDLRSIRQFNTGFQGSSVTVTGGPLRAAINAEHPVTMGFRYPAIEYENAAQLHVRGLQYRVDAQGAASGGGEVLTSESGGEIIDSTEGRNYTRAWETRDAEFADGGTPASVTFTRLGTIDDTWVTVAGTVGNTANPPVILDVSLFDGDTSSLMTEVDQTFTTTGANEYFVANLAAGDIERQRLDATVTVNAVDAQNNTVDITNTHARLIGVPDHTHRFNWGHVHEVTVSEHTHAQEPGIFTTEDTPQNVGVDINGTTVASDIGSGVFETTVDIGGEMSIDTWNDITLTSDALGLVQLTSYVTGYDQIGTRS